MRGEDAALAHRITPVFQDRFGSEGNCMQAAVASFLNLPLDAVPDFIESEDSDRAMLRFLHMHGYRMIDRPAQAIPAGVYFMEGISTQHHYHIVIAEAGKIIHDPNPHGGGLLSVDVVREPLPLIEQASDSAKSKRRRRQSTETQLREPARILRAIQPNAGLESWYRERLQNLAREMASDILIKLKRFYLPARLALDDDPIVQLRTMLRAWGRYWEGRFDRMSADISRMFARRSRADLERAMRKRLLEAGFTVRFRPSAQIISAYRAVIAENVALIKSIPRQFHKEVEGIIWSGVRSGGNLSAISKQMRKKYGITYRRAALIARDQSAKSKAVMERTRRAELGITEAIWQHSHAGKEPRPTHLAMHGKRYKIAEGMYDSAEGRHVMPGELINCRCVSRAILPGTSR